MSHTDTWAVSPAAASTTMLRAAAAVNAAGALTLLVNDTSVQGCGYKLIFTSGAGAAVTGVSITGTAGQFACAASTLSVNESIVISGTLGGTGTITGYVDPTTYYIIATNGTTTFTLSATLGGVAITTTAGTPTGLTYTLGNFGPTYTIVGNTVAQPNRKVTEVITVPNNTTANSTNYWARVDNITASTGLAGNQSIGITGSLGLPRTRIYAVHWVGAAAAGSVSVAMAVSGVVKLNVDTPASAAAASYLDTGQILLNGPTAVDFGVVTLTQVTKCTFICG